jgi:putative hydrolase of the HAD superfamily
MTSDSNQIKTIFWDIGGVILSNGWDRAQRARVLPPLGVDLAAYELRHSVENFYWERGRIDAETYFNRTLFKPAGIPQPNLDFTFGDLWPKVCGESSFQYPESFDILVALKSSGQFKLATLNNESIELNEYRLDTFGLRRQFDFFICSGYLNEMKPHPDIFRAAIRISGQPASTAVFIDDKQENIDAAQYHGMHGIRFESPAQLRTSLAKLGIKT